MEDAVKTGLVALSVSYDAKDKTARKFNANEALYRFLVDSLTDYAVFAVSPGGVVISWNTGAQYTFGYTADEIIGKSFDVIFTIEDVRCGAPQIELARALSGTQTQHDRWHVRKDNSRFWGTNTVQPLYDTSGQLLGFTKLVRDATTNYLALEALADSEQRLRLLVGSVHDFAIFSLELDGKVKTWNAGAEKIFGFLQADMIGRHFSNFYSAEDAAADVPSALLHKATLHGWANVDSWLMRKDGTRFLASGKLSELKRDAAGNLRGFVSVVQDSTAQHATTQELRRRAQVDELTELPNRHTFYEHVQRAIGSMKRRSANLFAVLFIDLDHFKLVNDEYGHIAADQLLAATARRFEHCVRAEDIVARIGGDEFGILLNGISGIADAHDAADRIGTLMRQPITIGDREVSATVSVGIAIGGPQYERPEDVLRDADAAMYSAKLNGRARALVFSSPNPTEGDDDLVSDLRHGLQRNELRIAYQPIFRLHDETLAGFGSLVRWEHPRRGLLLPVDFIGKVQETDLIVAIDLWMLAEGCRQLAQWQADGIGSRLQLSVNVSSKAFLHAGFPADLHRILESTGLAPQCLRIEISESVFMKPSDKVAGLVAAVRALGSAVDIDDSGTGFSALGAVPDLPVDALKIGLTSVSRLNSQTGAQMVETGMTLARKRGIATVAEGIETAQQVQQLTDLGCVFGQGLFFSPPLDAEAAGRYANEDGSPKAIGPAAAKS